MKNLVVYKGHNYPIWDVEFSPQNWYFATASHDHTSRVWSCAHPKQIRVLVGHLSDVEVSNQLPGHIIPVLYLSVSIKSFLLLFPPFFSVRL